MNQIFDVKLVIFFAVFIDQNGNTILILYVQEVLPLMSTEKSKIRILFGKNQAGSFFRLFQLDSFFFTVRSVSDFFCIGWIRIKSSWICNPHGGGTICPRSSDPFYVYVITWYVKWVIISQAKGRFQLIITSKSKNCILYVQEVQ